MANEPALRSVVQYIESQPEAWDQRFVARHGRMCVAGIACRLAGINVEVLTSDRLFAAGRRLLGLTPAQADRLFMWHGHPATVSQLKEEITAVTGMEW